MGSRVETSEHVFAELFWLFFWIWRLLPRSDEASVLMQAQTNSMDLFRTRHHYRELNYWQLRSVNIWGSCAGHEREREKVFYCLCCTSTYVNRLIIFYSTWNAVHFFHDVSQGSRKHSFIFNRSINALITFSLLQLMRATRENGISSSINTVSNARPYIGWP